MQEANFVADSLLEEGRFEPSVPLRWSVFPNRLFPPLLVANRVETDGLNPRETDGSNLAYPAESPLRTGAEVSLGPAPLIELVAQGCGWGGHRAH
jgi:hypothetical protein